MGGVEPNPAQETGAVLRAFPHVWGGLTFLDGLGMVRSSNPASGVGATRGREAPTP